ncbi:MAG TPA: N-acyl homoserine lactonase family protein [Stellaceae bacterium]|nr:N-acyl homoserine lactonase family protein [Stellaceae bacterium]
MSGTPAYEIYAVRYARHDRRAGENFLGGDPHDGPMPLDYFVWAIVGADRTFVVDTGFGAAAAEARGRELLRAPAEGLKAIGVDPARVEDVIITHMHYDHAGNLDLFPNAVFHIQDREMGYVTGRSMCHDTLRASFAVEDVVAMVRRLYAGRIAFHDGDDEIVPGVSLHFIGGHTMGLQSVRVATRRGHVVLASDAAHLYAHLDQRRAFPVVYNVADMLEGHAKLRRLASSPAHIVPGHDPLVMRRYPPARPELEGIVVRLD